MFDRELIENLAMTEQGNAFQPPYPEIIGNTITGDYTLVPSGAAVHEDGSVMFRVYAPKAQSVVVKLVSFEDVELKLEKDGNGVFCALLEYEDRFKGPQDVEIILDGTLYIHPKMPTHFRTFKIVNFVEIPDPESEMIMIRDVPHGQVVREVFFSKAFGTWERCNVYLPPQYRQGGEYPVMYLQHGLSENENEWVNMGKVNYIMDNLIAEGKAQPFIIVMCDGMQRKAGEGMIDFTTFEKMLVEDAMPFIEENYRVKTGKANRAMGGLSMGSMQTCVLGMKRPELFDYLGLFSGFMRRGEGITDFGKWEHLKMLAQDAAYMQKNFRLFFRSMGTKDRFYYAFEEDNEQLAALGSDKLSGYVAKSYEGFTHDWGAFRRGFRDFAQMIFKN